MNLPDMLNALGLTLNVVGAFLMFNFTPKVSFIRWAYTRAETPTIEQRARRMNSIIRLGMFLLFIGFIIQLAAVLAD